jgi:ketosteroid isomerase-like protein
MAQPTRFILAFSVLLTLCTGSAYEAGSVDLQAQVEEVERAFAKTLADRDHAAFTALLSEEAVFISGATVLRGKQAVAEQWKTYFTGPQAPFSWAPETVSVLDSGKLALSSGPVWDSEGNRVMTYSSIWRREKRGVWRIIFDKGNRHCE